MRVVASVPYLVEWINRHPFKDDSKAYLWVNSRLNPYGYSCITQMLYRIATRARITKKVNPHNFRHSRATYLANFLAEAQMKEYFGWTQDSKMTGIYIHLSGRDVDSALLKVYGIKNDNEQKESIFKPKECSRCQQVNQATNRFCSRCAMPLDEGSRMEVLKKGLVRKEADNIMDRLLEDPEFRQVLLRKVEMMKMSKGGNF